MIPTEPARRISVAAGLALLFVMAATLATGFLVRQRAEVLAQVSEIAAMHARAMEGFLTHGLETTAIVATGLDPTEDGAIRDSGILRSLPLVRSVAFLDPDGRVFASTNSRNLGTIVPLDTFFPPIERHGTYSLGAPWRGRDLSSGAPVRPGDGGAPDLGFVPLLVFGTHGERILIALNTDFLQTHFTQNLRPEAGRIDVLRYDGRLLVSSDPREHPGATDEEVLRNFDLTRAEFGPLRGPGSAFVGHVHASPTLPFAVVARIDRDRALEPWRDGAMTLVGILGVAGLVIGILIAVFVRRHAQIEAQHRAIERLRRVNAASVFANAREAIVITDARGTITDVNDSFHRLTGHGREDAVGRRVDILRSTRHGTAFWRSVRRELRGAGYWHGEIRLAHRSGDEFIAQQTISAVRDDGGAVRQYVALFTDVTRAREQAERLERAAHYDALTALPNRALLTDRLERAMAEAERSERSLAVVFIDVDGFKAVNDTFGHACGDDLLVAIALRLGTELGEGDVLGRLGGDEFVAVLLDRRDDPDCAALLDRLLVAIRTPIPLQGHEVGVGASLGVAFFPQEEPVDADRLLRQADQAMYRAKIAGKNRYSVFDAERDRAERVRHETLDDIRAAFEADHFVLHYQPIVDLATGRPVAMEGLIRWNHPTDGLVPPARFIPLIEGTPLAAPIGERVIEQALTELGHWLDAGLDLRVAVNVSGIHLQNDGFARRLEQALDRHGDRVRGRLEIEIPEAVALSDLGRVGGAIRACRRLGVRFALDDFGTGYSSLAYLEQLPFDLLKIDRSFVTAIGRGDRPLIVLEAILELAKKLGHATIAEGIELEAQREALTRLGCGLGQGFLFARPMPAGEVIAWSKAHAEAEAARGRIHIA